MDFFFADHGNWALYRRNRNGNSSIFIPHLTSNIRPILPGWNLLRRPDSREGRFTLVAPGVGASTRNQWTGSVLSRTLLLLGVRGRFSPPRCTHRCRATVAMEVSVPASVARSLEPPFSDHRAAYRCSRVETWRLLQQSSRSRDFLRSVWWNCRRSPCGSHPAQRW